jgi:hypothetical protein
MKMKQLLLLAILFISTIVTACTTIRDRASNSTSANSTSTQTIATQSNLVGLFLVKKDNLKNEFRGEVYPIALHLNGKYVDVSHDVTPQIRNDFQLEQLIKTHQQRNILSAVQSFTILDDDQSLGKFNIEKLSVSQFACSTLLTGQGQFTGEKSLPVLFEVLPKENAGSFQGRMADKEFDELWRFTIAINQPHASPATQASTQSDPTQYKADIIAAATTAIAQSSQGKNAAKVTVVERSAVYDLNHDGQPEVFATVRKGRDPKSIPAAQVGKPGNPIVYANVWLTYQNNRPIVISSQVFPYEYPVTKRPYNVIGAVDIDGNGIEEVIVRNNGYEATSFGIYELKNNQLQSVWLFRLEYA